MSKYLIFKLASAAAVLAIGVLGMRFPPPAGSARGIAAQKEAGIARGKVEQMESGAEHG